MIGRAAEKAELLRRYKSDKAEFVAVYGRRRVGKTFLINETLGDKITFHHTGLSPYDRKRRATLKDQLQNFYFSLLRFGMEEGTKPTSWLEAFFLLERFLERQDNGTRQVVFIDELPWMDTNRSGFLTALEAFWNGWASARSNILLVVCGSATSWMLDNLINNKGGLYGRLTGEIHLHPFSLHECEDYFKARNIRMSRYNVTQAYMILGGIPYYLDYFNASLSLAQNIDELFFARNAKLGDEFERLFNSIFDRADDCMNIVRILGRRHAGFTREEIAHAAGLQANGEFTKIMKALIASDFVIAYQPYGEARTKMYYKLADCFCWFWLHFKEKRHITQTDYWLNHLNEAEIASWRGIAFEEVCFLHIPQIKQALQIAGVASRESALIVKGSEEKHGMQIDMVIDRDDDVVNICEMKFSKAEYIVKKAYADKLYAHLSELEKSNPRKTFLMTYIGVCPLGAGEYADTFSAALTIDDLFRE